MTKEKIENTVEDILDTALEDSPKTVTNKSITTFFRIDNKKYCPELMGNRYQAGKVHTPDCHVGISGHAPVVMRLPVIFLFIYDE
jgi:hypothetical protein